MQKSENDLSLIVAMTFGSRVIGRDNTIPWRIPSDMRRFKKTTTGHPIIMGRKTWESLKRPLPDRTNIVVTRQKGYPAEGAIVVDSLEEAVAAARQAPGADEIFIIGGSELYQKALPFAKRLYLTLVNAHIEGDAFFPKIHISDWTCIRASRDEGVPEDQYPTLYAVHERRTSF